MTITTIIPITIAIIAIIAIVVFHHQIYYHFGVVHKRKLYRCGRLSAFGLYLICTQYRIKTIVNLVDEAHQKTQWYLAHQKFCANNGIQFCAIPILGIPTNDKVQQFIKLCESDSFPILIHCMQGVYRTGIMVAVYQKRFMQMDNQTIYDNLPRYGHNFTSARYKAFREFIKNYK